MAWGPFLYAAGNDYSGQEDPNKKVLKRGLLGAGVGAISAGASDGDAGKGALIGAGTNVIGGALLDSLESPPAPQAQPVYVQQSPQYAQPAAYPVRPQYVEPQPVYTTAPPRQDPNRNLIKRGLLGAGVGAISAGASDGDAGKGALIGAGTNIIGGALLDSLESPPPQPQPVYYQPAPAYPSAGTPTGQPKKKIIRTYNADGTIKSETEVWE